MVDPARVDLFGSSLVLAGGTSALVAGVTGSLHCALMCGPLACAGLPRGEGRRRAAIGWHLGRVGAYAAVGLALGLVGSGVSAVLAVSVTPYLPWVMVAGLVATALELGKHLQPIPGVARVSKALARAGARLPPSGRALALGAATPFLPCGLLYGLFLAAMATGSGAGGAAVMGLFALGGVPALGGMQAGAQVVTRYPKAALVLRKVVPLTAAGVLAYRAIMAARTGVACD